jgi:hypothetical protein
LSEPEKVPAAAARPAAARPAPRPLPSEEDVARWMAGEEVPVLAALFDQLNVKTFDGMVMQIRRDELLPQHWQVISALTAPPDEEFDALAEVARLAASYGGGELSERRLAALRSAWRELRGKRPALWTVADLYAALRRIYDKGLTVDFYDLLTATRDVWRGLSLPVGRQQLDLLWNCLDLMRQKTKR